MSVTMTTAPATNPAAVAISMNFPEPQRDPQHPTGEMETLARRVLRAREGLGPDVPSGTDHFTDPRRQSIDREGFCHHLHDGFEETVRHRGILGVAGYEQNLKLGARLARRLNDLASAHAGQSYSADQKIDVLA